MDRLAARAVPHHRRLALVRDADRGDVFRREPRASQRLGGDRELGSPYVRRIVLDPSGLRKQLLAFFLCDRHDAAAAIENDRARARRALVERENERHAASCYFKMRLMPLAPSSAASM